MTKRLPDIELAKKALLHRCPLFCVSELLIDRIFDFELATSMSFMTFPIVTRPQSLFLSVDNRRAVLIDWSDVKDDVTKISILYFDAENTSIPGGVCCHIIIDKCLSWKCINSSHEFKRSCAKTVQRSLGDGKIQI